MSTFIEDVRNGRVSSPTGKEFHSSLWSEIKQDKTRDVLDRQFAEAGLFFFNQLEEVRRRLFDTFTSFAQSPGESIRLIIGFQNRDFRRVQNSTEALVGKIEGSAYLESLMATEVQDDVQGTVSMDDSLAVDATSLIVRNLLSAQGSQNQQGLRIPDSEVETRVKEVFRFGKIYSYLEELWSECQWADALFDSQVTPPVLRLRQSDWGKRSTVSEYKINSVRIEQTLIAAERWKNATHPLPNAAWIKPEITLRESGQLLHPEVKHAPLLVGELPMDVIHVEVYQRFYSDI